MSNKYPEFPVVEPKLMEYQPTPQPQATTNPIVYLMVGFSGSDDSRSLSMAIGTPERPVIKH